MNQLLPLAIQWGIPTGQRRQFKCRFCGKEFCFVLQHNLSRLRGMEREQVASVSQHRLQGQGSTVTCSAIVHHQATGATQMSFKEEGGIKVPKVEGEYPCGKCPMVFSDQDSCFQHQVTHNKQKCDECGKIFPNISRLAQHKRFHSGERPIECKICGESFLRRVALDTHLKIHTDKHSHRCEECGLLVRGHRYLVMHQRTHSADRPYTCDYCGKIFICQSKLDDHKKIHERKRATN